ncbi:hypothetical protein RB597_007172 [Gaeumannomyces tritici]
MASQTPARPVPGAFLATPAPGGRPDPVRRRLFDTPSASTPAQSHYRPDAISSSATQAGQLQTQQPELPPVEKAANEIKHALLQDENYPEIDSFCRPGASSDYDVQAIESSWTPFQRTQMYPIPDRIFETYNMSHISTKMGLFAEIGHAYACIDNALLMWNFNQPNPEIIGFEDQPHSIQTVALVPPRPGVFLDSITHILVVATTSDLILLGLAVTSQPNGTKAVELYSTKMTLHAPSNSINIIASTSSGRVFFGGEGDTDIYELCYQQEEKWFSGRCSKINHSQAGWSSSITWLPGSGLWSPQSHEHLVDIKVDNTRNLLYTLSNKSTIRTYSIESANKLVLRITKEKNHCLRDITHMISRTALLTDRVRIVSISPIAAQEASKLHLMALTDTGCRLFLSATSSAAYSDTYSSTYTAELNPNLAPQSMQVQFVKFPPSATNPEANPLKTSQLGFRFAPGYFFDFINTTESGLTLFVSAPDAGRINHTGLASALKFYEHATWVDVGSKAVALDVGLMTKPFAAAKQPLGFGNELAVQFDDEPCEVAVLTSSGIYIIRRRRFVDIFAAAVRAAVGDEGLEKEVRKFVQLYGRVETISAALAVACGQGSDLRTGTGRAIDQATTGRAKTAFVTWGGQPTLAEADGNVNLTTPSVKLSSRHDALVLYLARLIRTLWNAKVIERKIDKTSVVVVNSTIPISKLTIVQENLERLRNFLKINKGIIQGLSGPADLQHVSSRQEEVALQAEHQSLHALQKLMESISEGISFVVMLFDERVADIYLRLDEKTQKQLQGLTYESLFAQSAGKELAKLLVKAIVNRNIESGSNVETVADALRRRCGSFCSPDDVIIFKAQEQLKRASEQSSNPNSQRALLSESLRLFEHVANSLTFANLEGAVSQYIDLKYYAAAIRLCLTVAKENDRGNSALAWINDNKPANDVRQTAFKHRKRCYDLIHTVLQRLDTASSTEPDLVDGKPTVAATKRKEAYSVVNDSDDEVFHFDLYEWYIEQNWTDRILAIDSPHVVTFLQRLATVDAHHAELLCRFYTHRGLFFEAAQVQSVLANSDFAIGIKDRITLLSRAKGNASVSTLSGNRQQQQLLSHEITELLEIAHIQDDLLERLRADRRIPDERKAEAEQALDGPIQGLSELFNTYADPAGYYNLCLLIYHAADFHQTQLIAETWKNLISVTHQEIEERREEYERQLAAAQRHLSEPPPPAPYESVSMQIQMIAHRTSLDTMIFPIDTLLPIVCEYAITQEQDESIGADNSWPVLLFLQLQVSPSVIVRILEPIFEAQEAPFTGRRRRFVGAWINTAVEAWLREVERHGLQSVGRGPVGDGSSDGILGSWVFELLGRVAEDIGRLAAAGREHNAATMEAEEVVRRAKQLRLSVEKAVRQQGLNRTMRFMA